MAGAIERYDVTGRDIIKDKTLRYTALGLPFVGAALPSILFFILFLLSSTVPTSAMFFFLSLISLVVGFVVGGLGSIGTLMYRSRWLGAIRERIAIDGIRTEEVRWFRNELKSEERKALKEIESKNLMLADAYRETLASRLTATRIIKTTKHELLLARRRNHKLKYLKSERLEDFKKEIERDVENLTKINNEALEMEAEAESRLQMIEAASRRGTELAGSELALKKLSARSEQLPLALESARMEEEIRRELEKETDEVLSK